MFIQGQGTSNTLSQFRKFFIGEMPDKHFIDHCFFCPVKQINKQADKQAQKNNYKQLNKIYGKQINSKSKRKITSF